MIDEEGKRPSDEHIQAILDLQPPKNKKGLQKFLGVVNYLSQYIPNLADLTAPLRWLLRKDAQWVWVAAHSECLEDIKVAVCNISKLATFDPSLHITVQCDASQFGLGACLIQSKKPIAFASRSLNNAETRYSQIEKELLSIVFAIKKFHRLVYGHDILVENDHKPLENIFRKPVCVSNRLQRLMHKLINYQISVKYDPDKDMIIADYLSRNFKQTDVPIDQATSEVVHCLEINFAITPNKILELRDETNKDPVLHKILNTNMVGITAEIRY